MERGRHLTPIGRRTRGEGGRAGDTYLTKKIDPDLQKEAATAKREQEWEGRRVSKPDLVNIY